MTKPTGNPQGRPAGLDDPCRLDHEGNPQTVSARLLELVAIGLDLTDAAVSVGINRNTVRNWRRQGAAALAREVEGHDLTPAEWRYAEFLRDLESAEVQAEEVRVANIRRVGEGGWIVTEVTEEWKLWQPEGSEEPALRVLVGRKITTKTAPPNWQADMTWLERRMPHKYRRRTEVTGADGAPLIPADDEARQLAAELRAFQQGLEEGTREKS
jgi:hypothetical protein